MANDKSWQITIQIEDTKDVLQLTDIKDLFPGYLAIDRTFFDELMGIVKMISKYSVGKGIEKVVGPDKRDWTKNPWLLLIAQDKESQISYRYLIKREKDLNGFLVGLGPDQITDVFKKSQNAEEEIKQLLQYVISYPEKFKLIVLIPNFIA